MSLKEEIDQELEKVFDPDFVKLWWGLKLPGLGGISPRDKFEQDPQFVRNYVNGYDADE